MSRMKTIAGLGLLVLLASGARAEVAMVQRFDWKRAGDSIRLEFRFPEGVRPRYRIRTCPESEARHCLHIEIASGRLASDAFVDRPQWLDSSTNLQTGILDFRVDLVEATPWKFAWTGNRLDVDILDRVRGGSIARNPWMYGGVGAGLVAGGILFWFLNGGSTPPAGPEIIPPPDVELPKK